jgi:hypothetical protein
MPEELIYGAELIPNVEGQPPQPHYLHPGQVEEAAAWLAQRPFVDLVESVDPDAARAASPYSVGEWNDDDRSFVADWASDLPAFFAAAAKNGDAFVIGISF